MNVYPKEYFGQLITLIGQTDNADLIQIGDRLVRVKKSCQIALKSDSSKEIVKAPKLKLVWVRKP